MADGLREVIIPYAPRPVFIPWHDRTQRWSVTAAHRRSGKTVSRVNGLIKGALTCTLVRPRFGYIAPFLKQAKTVAWDYFKHYSSPIIPLGASINEADTRIDYPNGGQIRLFGADNPDALRGIYLDGVVFDEFATMDPEIWPVVRPALSDRNGWADFIGTPNGHNEFHRILTTALTDPEWYATILKASETGLLSAQELASAKKDLTEDQYSQEYECSFEAAIRGAYYGRQLAQADKDKRICNVAYDPGISVNTVWDLGIGDSTAIWLYQMVSQEIRLVDYYEGSGVGLDHYVKWLREKPYAYGQHFFPHDVKVRELGSGKSREETLRSLGILVSMVPNVGIEDGINAVRRILPRCWFDKTKCERGIEALRQYQTEWDDKLKTFKKNPRHDWTSHAADAFRYLALSVELAGPAPDLTQLSPKWTRV